MAARSPTAAVCVAGAEPASLRALADRVGIRLLASTQRPRATRPLVPRCATRRAAATCGLPLRRADAAVSARAATALLIVLDHLWERDVRQPALLALSIEIAFRGIMEDVYRGWCKEHRVRPRVRRLQRASDADSVRSQARSLLETTNSPDAILAAADGSALPALDAARELGHQRRPRVLVASSIGSPAGPRVDLHGDGDRHRGTIR